MENVASATADLAEATAAHFRAGYRHQDTTVSHQQLTSYLRAAKADSLAVEEEWSGRKAEMSEDVRESMCNLYVGMCHGYNLLQDYRRSLVYAHKATRVSAKSRKAWRNKSVVYHKLGKVDKAVESLERILEFDDQAFGVMMTIALLLLKSSRIDYFEKGKGKNVRVKRARVKKARGLLRKVASDGNATLSGEATTITGQMLLTIDKNYSEAMRMFKEALQESKDSKPRRCTLYYLALVTERMYMQNREANGGRGEEEEEEEVKEGSEEIRFSIEDVLNAYWQCLGHYPEDEDTLASLSRLYKDVKDDDEKSKELRERLYDLHDAKKTDKKYFERTRFKFSGNTIAGHEFFELTRTEVGWRSGEDSFEGNLKYRFLCLDEEDNIRFRISLGSYDISQLAVTSGNRMYHLDGYFPGVHKTYEVRFEFELASPGDIHSLFLINQSTLAV